MMSKVKNFTLRAAMALALGGGAATAYADALLFDPDGTGATFGTVAVTSFDWTQTSFVAQGGQTAIANFLANQSTGSSLSTNFTVMTMATLGSMLNTGTNVTPTGLGQDFQITMILKYGETVTAADPVAGSATFKVDTSAPVIFEMFYNSTAVADPLTGNGFSTGDLILRGTAISNSTGFFLLTDTTSVPLDGTVDGDDYVGQETVSGTGSNTSLTLGGFTQDNNFFKNLLNSFGFMISNVSIGLPYSTVDPSHCFNQTSQGTAVAGTTTQVDNQCDDIAVNGLFSANSTGGLGYLPVIGVTNGLFGNQAPDFVAQTDFNSTVSATTVPEPASLALLGIGLAGMGAMRRRRV